MHRQKLRMLVEIALFASIGAVLNKLTFNFMPQGGGISLSMIPVLLMAIRHGFLTGFMTGMLIGFVDVATGVKVYHWAQVFLDHCLADAVVAFVAVCNQPIKKALANSKKGMLLSFLLPSIFLAAFAKFFVHVISGVIFFYMYANGQNIWLYSIIYNATPMIPTTIVTMICMLLLLSSAPRLVKPSFA